MASGADDAKVDIEIGDVDAPDGGLGSPHCGTSLLDHGSIECVGDWQDGSLKEEADRFRPTDLDKFYARVYDYCRERGFGCIVAGRVLNLLALSFMIGFTAFLGLFVNWKIVLSCDSAATCDEQDLFNPQPFASRWVIRDGKPIRLGPDGSTLFVSLFLLVCLAWLVQSAGRALVDVKEFYGIKRFVNDRMGVTEREMGTIEWNELVSRLIELQQAGVLVTKHQITPLDITNRIMRKDNYFIAMINKGVINMEIPWLSKLLPPMLTRSMEWNLQYCILGHMFDAHTFSVKQRFISDPDALKWRLISCGVLNLVLSPFIAIFVLLYSFFRYGQEMHKNPASLGVRHWSPLARWKLREFNELEHFFDKRLNSSFKPATEYVNQFPSTEASIVAKFVVFIASSFCGVIVVLSLIDQDVLLYVTIFNRNLLWYLAVFGMVVAAAAPFVMDTHENFEPDQAFAKVAQHTHYYPSRWRHRIHTSQVYDAFSSMFPLRIVSFFYEVLSIFLVPILLIWYLPKQARQVTDFVRDFTETTDQLGDVCSFAVFDFERHGHALYGSHVAHDKYYRSKGGKMEKSFLTFLENNPNWTPSEDGQQLVRKVQAQQELGESMGDSLGSVKFGVSSMHSSLDDLYVQNKEHAVE